MQYLNIWMVHPNLLVLAKGTECCRVLLLSDRWLLNLDKVKATPVFTCMPSLLLTFVVGPKRIVFLDLYLLELVYCFLLITISILRISLKLKVLGFSLPNLFYRCFILYFTCCTSSTTFNNKI